MAELIQYANGVPGIKWPLDKIVIRIGRSVGDNEISLDDAFMSKFHAQIEIIVNEDQSGIDYYLSDMQSTNHTYINQALIEHTCLSHNDIVVIGKSKFVFLSAGVREYLSLEKLRRHSVDLSAKESDESLSIALEEITEEIKSPDADELVNPVYASESGQYKFSRRLNSY